MFLDPDRALLVLNADLAHVIVMAKIHVTAAQAAHVDHVRANVRAPAIASVLIEHAMRSTPDRHVRIVSAVRPLQLYPLQSHLHPHPNAVVHEHQSTN